MADSVFSAIVNGPFLGWLPCGVSPWSGESWVNIPAGVGTHDLGTFEVPSGGVLELSSCCFFATREGLDGTNLRTLMSDGELLEYCLFSLTRNGSSLWETSETQLLNQNMVEGLHIVVPEHSVFKAEVTLTTAFPPAAQAKGLGVRLRGRRVSSNIIDRLEAIHQELMRRAY